MQGYIFSSLNAVNKQFSATQRLRTCSLGCQCLSKYQQQTELIFKQSSLYLKFDDKISVLLQYGLYCIVFNCSQ